MLRILTLLYVVYQVIIDVKDDNEKLKIKIIHFLSCTILTYDLATSYAYLGSLIRKFDTEYEKYHQATFFFNENISTFFWLFHLIISCLTLSILFGLCKRKERSRKSLLKVLPVCIISGTAMSYIGDVLSEKFINNDTFALASSLIFKIIFFGTFYLIYSSKSMTHFFNKNSENTSETNKA